MRLIRWVQALVTFAAVIVGSIAPSHSSGLGPTGSAAIADHAYDGESVESSSTDTALGGNGAEQQFLQGAWPWTSPTHAYDHPAALGPSGVPRVSGFFAPQTVPGSYLVDKGFKAQRQVTPGTRVVEGEFVNDIGPGGIRVEPWRAHYDEYGRLIARTDFNAGNSKAGISNVHHSTYEWGPGCNPCVTNHIPGEFKP